VLVVRDSSGEIVHDSGGFTDIGLQGLKVRKQSISLIMENKYKNKIFIDTNTCFSSLNMV